MESSETRTIAAQVTLSNTNVKPKFNWDFKTGSNTVSDTSSITTFKNELTLTKPNPGEYIIDLTVEA